MATACSSAQHTRSASRTAISVILVFLGVVTAVAACDGSSGNSKSSAPVTPPATTSSSAAPLRGVPVGTDPQTRLQVDQWGYTADGLISVIVSNVGDATVRSARAIISATDAYGNLVAAVSAPQGTALGTRCCTIIGLAPGHRYGLYSDIGTRLPRVKKVTVQYTSVRTDASNVASPVQSITNPVLHTDGKQATAFVTVTMAKQTGPYITVQALVDGPDKKFLGIISSGFYCIGPNTKRTIKMQFFHPVPAGSTVDSVVAFPLDTTTARIEKLKTCHTG